MSPSQAERSNAMETLESFKLQPEFFNYLCYILIEGESDTALQTQFSAVDLQNARATAGMLLKNSMLSAATSHNIDYVKSNIVHGLYSSNPLVSNVTGIVITTLFSTHYCRQNRGDPTGIQMLSQLLELSSHNNEASIKALSKIMEDSAQFFTLQWGTLKPMDTLVDSFLKLMTNEASAVIRSESIKCLNTVIPLQTQSFIVRLDEFLSKLFQLAQTDDNNSVRAQLCVAFVNLLEFRPDKLVDHLTGIVQFVLHLINTVAEENVALEACEFLLALATNSHIPENVVKPYVDDVVPVLLSKMVFNREDIFVLESSNDDDADLDDKDEDIRPVAAKISKKRDVDGASDGSGGARELDADDDGEDDEDDDGDIDTQWNLRKCSAATLDVLTGILPREVLSVAFPILREHLMSEQWFIREATLLSLGAMADGGIKYFGDQLPTLIPFLVQELGDHWAPVRKIACWTLSRFSPWILQDHTEFLIPVLEPILNTLVDKKKGVQEAAISSVAAFIESCDAELVETLLYSELLAKFSQCFQFYKKKNLIILYDAVGRLAEKCEMDEAAMQMILPHLVGKWSSLADTDKELWPLLECLSCVAASLGEKFLPMAPEVYSRAWRILRQCVELEAKTQHDPSVEVPEKDFVITSLDLIDGLVQGLGPQSQQLLFPGSGSSGGSSDTSMFHVLLQCLQDPVHEVRQSCYALLGDIAYFYEPSLLEPYLAEFLKCISVELVHNDDADAVPTVNNAIWSLGLISEKIDLGEHIISMSRLVLDLFTTTGIVVQSSVLENLAVTIGRMAHFRPEVFTFGVFTKDSVWEKWCTYAQNLQDPEEKASAYWGFVKIMNLMNPELRMSPRTLKSFVQGASTGLDVHPFAEDLYALLINNAATLQSLELSPDEMVFLQQFM